MAGCKSRSACQDYARPRSPQLRIGQSSSARRGNPELPVAASRAGRHAYGGLMVRSRLLVLASGEGTLLQHLIDACATGSLRAEIVAVGSDRQGTRAASRAAAAGIDTFVCRVGDYGS